MLPLNESQIKGQNLMCVSVSFALKRNKHIPLEKKATPGKPSFGLLRSVGIHLPVSTSAAISNTEVL